MPLPPIQSTCFSYLIQLRFGLLALVRANRGPQKIYHFPDFHFVDTGNSIKYFLPVFQENFRNAQHPSKMLMIFPRTSAVLTDLCCLLFNKTRRCRVDKKTYMIYCQNQFDPVDQQLSFSNTPGTSSLSCLRFRRTVATLPMTRII